MPRPILESLNDFFVVFHGTLILFILVGWIWPRTRPLHLLVIGLTVSSWFVLGFFYGFGYCPFTDWHWQVKEALGETNLPNTYVKYYLDRLSGRQWDDILVGRIVGLIGLIALAVSVALNRRDRRRPRTS